jgi:predicted dehydrogenase
MQRKIIRFAVIGCGQMGREFASAVGRWKHLLNLDFEPQIVAACDKNQNNLQWFSDCVPTLKVITENYLNVLDNSEVEAVYCAIPHDQHEEVYVNIIKAGKHLLGEKPFGIDIQANNAILKEYGRHSKQLIRCCSEFPFYPGAYRISSMMQQAVFGKIIEVDAGFWHSSDLDPDKPINWKRRIAQNGEYGCMGDLGMHTLHLPLRFGWKPDNVRGLLTKVYKERPDATGKMIPCETWDNANLACEVIAGVQKFPMQISMKRIAPGNINTWFLKIYGTENSAEYSTKNPKELRMVDYSHASNQDWKLIEPGYHSAYPTITGEIFEFGFSDAILQMWAAFCDELVHGRENMLQPLYCVTPEETAESHIIFTAALESERSISAVHL